MEIDSYIKEWILYQYLSPEMPTIQMIHQRYCNMVMNNGFPELSMNTLLDMIYEEMQKQSKVPPITLHIDSLIGHTVVLFPAFSGNKDEALSHSSTQEKLLEIQESIERALIEAVRKGVQNARTVLLHDNNQPN